MGEAHEAAARLLEVDPAYIGVDRSGRPNKLEAADRGSQESGLPE
jgi:hypothetical protein